MAQVAEWSDFPSKQERLEQMKKLLENTRPTGEMLAVLEKLETSAADVGTAACIRPAEPGSAGVLSAAGQTLAQLLKRPEVSHIAVAFTLGGLEIDLPVASFN